MSYRDISVDELWDPREPPDDDEERRDYYDAMADKATEEAWDGMRIGDRGWMVAMENIADLYRRKARATGLGRKIHEIHDIDEADGL